MKELSKTYNPKETEGEIYTLWEKAEAFKPAYRQEHIADGEKEIAISDKQSLCPDDHKPYAIKPFVIVIPPPNVTGSLHMGHALNNTIQDILIRRSRMKGVPTLWVPGTDHAGIATQNVVEKALAKKGLSRQELGREKFVAEIEKWVQEYGHIIIDQLKKLGCSCDWSRQRFTMDEDYSEAVKAAFEHCYQKGWIYQGERVINWCVRCQTALSDIEVEHQDQKAKLYYFKYDKNFPITIATTRPETKLGDTAVAVNPKDKRYEKYIGQTFKVSFVGVAREIKIIGDPSIDMNFGTGAVGVTPAHSLVDAELAEKHGLDTIKIIDQYGRMTPEAGVDYEGLKVAEAQEKIIEKLKSDNLLEKTEEIDNALSICYRCGKPIEPQPSKQWFLKMSELAQPAIEAVEKGEIKFVPDRWNKVYLDWMKNLKDWCISRQIWWGHRLPVWEREVISKSEFLIYRASPAEILPNYKQIPNPNFQNNQTIEQSNNDIYVGSNPPKGYEQSFDVLDTWFSSALWPFATLGWPENKLKTQKSKVKTDLEYFYPTTILSTARDIIYLWVARMIFSGYEFMKKKPFETVYIHPTIFNIEGKRMSKSLGTGVDPLELIEKYGADATRFGLTYINTGIQDLKFDEEAIKAGQKFANKVWNIARFIMMNLASQKSVKSKVCKAETESDKKILERLNQIIKSTDKNLDEFKFGQAAHDLYDFVWHDFADVYIEQVKTQMSNVKTKENSQVILLHVLTSSLKLLHPIMPFVTEQIWQTLYAQKLVEEKLLINAQWPEKSN